MNKTTLLLAATLTLLAATSAAQAEISADTQAAIMQKFYDDSKLVYTDANGNTRIAKNPDIVAYCKGFTVTSAITKDGGGTFTANSEIDMACGKSLSGYGFNR